MGSDPPNESPSGIGFGVVVLDSPWSDVAAAVVKDCGVMLQFCLLRTQAVLRYRSALLTGFVSWIKRGFMEPFKAFGMLWGEFDSAFELISGSFIIYIYIYCFILFNFIFFYFTFFWEYCAVTLVNIKANFSFVIDNLNTLSSFSSILSSFSKSELLSYLIHDTSIMYLSQIF